MSTGLSILSDQVVQKQKIKKSYSDLWPKQYTNRDRGTIYTPHNEDEYFFVYSNTPTRMLLKGGEGAGKGHPLDTIIPTPNGYTTIRELKIGDIIFNEFGEETKVIALSEIFHKDCYELEFDTGEKIVCDEDHLWTIEDYNYRKSLSRRGVKYPDRTQAKHHLKTLDTKIIFETQNLCYLNRTNYSIPLAKPLKLPEVFLTIHPYVLGSWLGDGTSRAPQLTINDEDAKDTILIYKQFGYTLKKLKSKYQYRIQPNDKGMLLNCLRNLGILQNKHIPVIYLRASYQQRLELLQGLMDTDGYIDENGRCEFCSADKNLALQFVELCLSLGIKATSKKGKVKYNNTYRDRYRVCFTPNISVFRLKRKLNKIQNGKSQQIRKQRRYIVNVKKVNSVPTKCIKVDNPTGLYLVTKNLIPTHNSVAGIIKTLNRLQNGMSGLMASPTLPHFSRSLWQEFCRWCPPNVVIERHRHRLKPDWKPNGSFQMLFHNKYGGYSTLECGGFIEKQMGYWEGPTVSFVYADEIRQHKEPVVLKTLEGRIRMPGPMQEPPQIYFTTTPRKHWLFDYFGPIQRKDKFADFKKNMFCGTIPVELNKDNLAEGYIDLRKQSLTEAEIRVLMNAEWEDTSDILQFIQPEWWNPGCYRLNIPNYNKEACVCAIDASKGRESTKPDNAALVVVSSYPEETGVIIPRYVKIWDLDIGQQFDYSLLTKEIDIIKDIYSIIEYSYDPYQLAYWAQEMRKTHPAYYREFGQEKDRLLSDSALQQRIMSQKIYHNGDKTLFEHVKNANCKKYRNDEEENRYRVRMVKRNNSDKIDAAVALSMACYRLAFYNTV